MSGGSEPGGGKCYHKHDFLKVYLSTGTHEEIVSTLDLTFSLVLVVMNHSMKVMPNGTHWKLPAICASFPCPLHSFRTASVAFCERPFRSSFNTAAEAGMGWGSCSFCTFSYWHVVGTTDQE